MRNTVFSFKNLEFRFPENTENTLTAISFDIQQGERTVVSGPSGCGKSTLLYLMNRLYPFNCDGVVNGEIRLFGKRAEDYAPGEINHRVATVFQDPDSQFCMPTVEEELAFSLENLQVPPKEMERRIQHVLDETGLSKLRNAVIQSLSGGMKQRIATACALVMEPEVLLLDEPISHLDPVTAKKFIHWLDALQRKFGLTIVAVEHRLDLWESFFDREISLDASGKLSADAPFAARMPMLFPERVSSVRQDTALNAHEIFVEIKGKPLLAPMSFSVQLGEVVVVAGPNGSGKSSLLKALCGILPLAGGNVLSLPIGYVPQSPEYLFLEQTVAAELAFSGASSADELAPLMARLRLLEIQDAHPFAVSHGQKRRVATGAMLADKRQVLLMDEPTSGQDTAALLELHELIAERAREGAALLIVTHDMEFASSVADSVLLIKDGKLSGKIPAEAVWKDPELLGAHSLLPPKGEMRVAESFA